MDGIGYEIELEPLKKTGLFLTDDDWELSMGYDSVVSGVYFDEPEQLEKDVKWGIMSQINEYMMAPYVSMCLGELRDGECHGESAWIVKAWVENLDEVAEKLTKKILKKAEKLAEKLWGLTL